jgi:outer membrane protein assembly factor BamB
LGSGTSLLAINKETGELAWSYKTDGAIESRPAVAGDKVICTSWDTHVYCLNRFTGGKIWFWGYQSSMYYAPGAGWPVIMNDLVFVVDPSKQMTCLSLADGSEQWKSSNPQVWDSIGKNEKHTQVYIRSLDGKLYAFAPSSDRDLLWSAPAEFGFDAKPSMPFGKMGAVFAGGSSGNMVAVSQATGEIKWMYHTAHTLVNSVTPKDGVSAFMTCLDGTVAYITGDPSLDIKTSKTPDFENLLLPAYPNPFNNMTTIQYTLKSAQKISIHIYDLLGKEIMSKSRIHNQPGHYHYTWQAVNDSEKNLASGLYIVKLEGQGFIDQKKILYLK